MLQNIFGNQKQTASTNTIPGLSFNAANVPTQETPMGYDPVLHGFEGFDKTGFTDVIQQGDGFRFTRQTPGQDSSFYDTRTANLNPDGTLAWQGSWNTKQKQSQMDHFLSAGLPMALAMAGGMYATGGFGGAGATAGAGAGTGGGSLATNPALIESAAGTAGYGASSAGAGGVGGLSSLLNGGLPKLSTGNSVADKLLGNVAKSFLGGGSGGISNLGNLSSLFSNYKQYSNTGKLMDEIKGIYSPDGPYAKRLEQELGRRDAAAGRNSQYGPRLEELMGRLGDSQARALQGLGPMMATQQGGLNGMLGAGNRLLGDFNLMDLFGGNSLGGMLSGELGSTPDMWDRAADDIDWEALFGG